MNKKNFFITFGITSFLFLFVLFLIYLIYCYAYFDKEQELKYIDSVNRGNYDFIYNNLNNNFLSKNEFYNSINLMYDKSILKNIYFTYYENRINISLEDFINEFYFGDYKIDSKDVSFNSDSKTNLFKRRKLYYDDIVLESKSGNKSSLGLKSDILLKIEEKSILNLDGKEVVCDKNECLINQIFGGLHEIKYISNNFEYYGIINIIDNKQVIEITMVDSLVNINKNNKKANSYDKVNKYKLNYGLYKLDKCYLDSSCPSKKDSYIRLNEDGTCVFYTYITLDQAGDSYFGTYKINGNFLVMKFDNHIYNVFDYDTKEKTDIFAESDMEISYKIEYDNILVNDMYKFIYFE